MATPPSTPKTSSYSTDQAPPRPQTQSAPRGRKMSDYGRQLVEKQKARNEYGLREAQFRRYFERAAKSTLATGQELFSSLERRLDNVLFRAGIAKSRRMGRQLVVHGLVRVNDKRISMPSYTVQPGDTILATLDNIEWNKEAIVPDWLSYDQKKRTVRVERAPKADDLVTDINSQLIIEYYSR